MDCIPNEDYANSAIEDHLKYKDNGVSNKAHKVQRGLLLGP